MKFLIIALLITSAHNALAQKPLTLTITFPAKNDTVAAERVRLSGFTDPGAALYVNDKRIGLTPQGSFVTRVNLAEELNRIIISAQKNGAKVQDSLFIFRPPTPKSLPFEPTAIEEAAGEPKEEVWLSRGDFLNVLLKGSPGGYATFSVEKVEKHIPMVEIDSLEAGVAGIYRGVLRIGADLPTEKPLNITFELHGRDGRKKTAEAAGRLTILSEKTPLVAQIRQTASVHRSAERHLPMMRLTENVRLQVIGREKKRYKVRFSEQQIGFVDMENLTLLPSGTPLPQVSVSAPVISQDRDWFRLVFTIDRPVAFTLEKAFDSNRLDLTLFGVQQSSHWITYPSYPIDLQNLLLSQQEELVFRVSVALNQKRLWGYKVEFGDKTMTFAIRRTPDINAQNPLQGITVALDPGHGGDEHGAISPLGVLEKDVNLKWAQALAVQLSRAGARAVLTREADETVSLSERIGRAEAAEALFFLSLHNNGVPPSGNAAVAEGTGIFFTLPQNQEPAWAIFPHLVRVGLKPYGRVYNSYYVTNSTAFLAVLIEGGFLTHPQEELKLADPVFIERMASAIVDGLTDFLRAQK